jgi:hypothetical protein
MDKLKPCPFCGEMPMTNVKCYTCDGETLALAAEVKCKCGISKTATFNGQNRSFDYYNEAFLRAIEAWNMRVKE